jgi:hypothetical protein
MINYDQVNQAAEQWHRNVKRQIRNNIKTKTKHRPQPSSPRPLAQRIGGKSFKKFGVVERMNITFPKHLVFREKMVGKGRPVGTNKPDPLVNPVLNKSIEELANKVGEAFATVAMKNIFID